MTKKLLMGTNLKMYKDIRQTADYLERLQELTADLRNDVTVFVIPSYTSLDRARATIADRSVLIGAQNMYPAEEGQFTGEISPKMLQELNVDIVEIGHSERRHVFHEKDKDENLKVISAIAHGFTALLCIGETAEQKTYGIADEILAMQLKMGLYEVDKQNMNRIWIAYEPVWAIGVNGKPAEPTYVEQRHLAIRKTLEELLPGGTIPILYGGSVNAGNAASLLSLENVDGLFVGRAAWAAEQFDMMIRSLLPVWAKK